MLQSQAAFIVVCEELGGSQYLLLLFRELTLVEIAIQIYELLCRKDACLLILTILANQLLAVAPPGSQRVAMLQTHGLRLGEVLVSIGHIQAVEPRLIRAEALCGTLRTHVIEEEDIGRDAGIGREDTPREAYDRVQVEVSEELLLDRQLGIICPE